MGLQSPTLVHPSKEALASKGLPSHHPRCIHTPSGRHCAATHQVAITVLQPSNLNSSIRMSVCVQDRLCCYNPHFLFQLCAKGRMSSDVTFNNSTSSPSTVKKQDALHQNLTIQIQGTLVWPSWFKPVSLWFGNKKWLLA
jgi:hypothetical protein